MKSESFIAVNSPLSIIRTLSSEERSLPLQLIKLCCSDCRITVYFQQVMCYSPRADEQDQVISWKKKKKRKKSTNKILVWRIKSEKSPQNEDSGLSE